MGWIKRLKQNELVGGTGTDDVYPITSTGAVIQPGTNKTAEELLAELGNGLNSKKVVDVSKESDNLIINYSNGDSKTIPESKPTISMSVWSQGDNINSDYQTSTFVTKYNNQIIGFVPKYRVIPYFGIHPYDNQDLFYASAKYFQNIRDGEQRVKIDNNMGYFSHYVEFPNLISNIEKEGNKLKVTKLSTPADFHDRGETINEYIDLPASSESKTLTIKSDKGSNAETLGTFNNSSDVTINIPIEFVNELPANPNAHTLYLLPVETD